MGLAEIRNIDKIIFFSRYRFSLLDDEDDEDVVDVDVDDDDDDDDYGEDEYDNFDDVSMMK